MRPIPMTKLRFPLAAIAALVAAALLTGCASSSGSTAGSASSASSASSSGNSPSSTARGASLTPVATTPAAAPTSSTGTAPTPTTMAALTSAAAPAGPGRAILLYVGPVGTTAGQRLHSQKTVTGPAYDRLLADLAALTRRPATVAQCNVETGESATITVVTAGHTLVYSIPGSPCRGVSLTSDGVSQPTLSNNMTLLEQVRDLAGFTGMAHPLTS